MGDKIVCRVEVPYFISQTDKRINRNYDLQNPEEAKKFVKALIGLIDNDFGVRVICFKE